MSYDENQEAEAPKAEASTPRERSPLAVAASNLNKAHVARAKCQTRVAKLATDYAAAQQALVNASDALAAARASHEALLNES